MTSAEFTPRQLAPTVGPAAALAGVFFRTGSLEVSGRRIVSGLIHRVGSQNALIDNTGCFGDKPVPRNGCLIKFGSFVVYVATEVACRYPERVLVAEDPPAVYAVRGQRLACSASRAEVMVVAQTGEIDGHISEDSEASPRTTRSAKNPIERVKRNTAGAESSAAGALAATIANLGRPVQAEQDPEAAQIQLEEQRQLLLEEAVEMAKIRAELDRSQREYDAAQSSLPSRWGRVAWSR